MRPSGWAFSVEWQRADYSTTCSALAVSINDATHYSRRAQTGAQYAKGL